MNLRVSLHLIRVHTLYDFRFGQQLLKTLEYLNNSICVYSTKSSTPLCALAQRAVFEYCLVSSLKERSFGNVRAILYSTRV